VRLFLNVGGRGAFQGARPRSLKCAVAIFCSKAKVHRMDGPTICKPTGVRSAVKGRTAREMIAGLPTIPKNEKKVARLIHRW